MIIFKNNKYTETLISKEQTVIEINKIVFNSKDPECILRLFTSSLKFTETYYNCQKQKIGSSSVPMSLAEFITPKHREPVLEINQVVEFDKFNSENINESVCFWEITVTIELLKFEDGETMTVFVKKQDQV